MRSRQILAICMLGLLLVGCESIDQRKERRRMRGAGVRIIATGIEQYYVDNNAYPTPRPMQTFVHTDAEREKLKKARGWQVGAIDHRAMLRTDSDVTRMKTRYFPDGIDIPLIDEHAPVKGMPFAYYSDANGWILWSPGPDGIYDIDGSVVYDSSTTQPVEILVRKSYDPTNGATSGGDIWQIKG